MPEGPRNSGSTKTSRSVSAEAHQNLRVSDLPLERAMVRVVWSVLGGFASGGFAALAARTIDITTPLAIIAGGMLGGLIACALALQSILAPARRGLKNRWWLITTLGELARANREMEFQTLIDESRAHELEDVALACHEALLSAHRDRLEAAALRREMDHRVEKRTRVTVARLSRISSTDELTGLLNRRGFDQALCEMWNAAADRGEELALIAIDLDHFKELNDTLGHQAGDEALRAVGQTLRSGLREGDVAGRIGGDELIVCVRGTDSTAARAVAERFMTNYSQHAGSRGSLWPTMSIGVACAGEHGAKCPEHLRRMADESLYAAKRGGRSMCVVCRPSLTGSVA